MDRYRMLYSIWGSVMIVIKKADGYVMLNLLNISPVQGNVPIRIELSPENRMLLRETKHKYGNVRLQNRAAALKLDKKIRDKVKKRNQKPKTGGKK